MNETIVAPNTFVCPELNKKNVFKEIECGFTPLIEFLFLFEVLEYLVLLWAGGGGVVLKYM